MTKAQLKKLYGHRQLSMMEIAHKLGTTHATVLYWLKKHGIPRRSWSDSTYIKLNPDGDPFRLPKVLTRSQQELLVAGLLLYWAEGDKTNKSGTKIGNLDGQMLQVFIKFLREVCHADENRLSVYVRVHKRFSLGAARQHWVQLLGLPPSRVHIYRHTDKRSKADKQWSPHGLAILEFHSTKFKRWFDQVIRDYVNYLLRESRSKKISWTAWRQRESLFADGDLTIQHGFLTDEAPTEFNPLTWATQANLNN